jgi:hypothetical protein
MRVIINDKEVVFPSSLSDVTLGQRIDFYNEHGRLLDEMIDSIAKIEDTTDQEIELAEFAFEKMFRIFSFFAGTTVEAVKESEFIDQVAEIYYKSLAPLFEPQTETQLRESFTWNGETWVISKPELIQGSKMSFGEFIDAKQAIQDMEERGAYEKLLKLCVTLKPNEKRINHDESFLAIFYKPDQKL